VFIYYLLEEIIMLNKKLNLADANVLTEALKIRQQALFIFETTYGNHHPNVAAVLREIGTIHKFQGKYQEALNYYQRSLASFGAIGGKNDEDVAIVLNYINDVSDLINSNRPENNQQPLLFSHSSTPRQQNEASPTKPQPHRGEASKRIM
jgi:tetratricopeptide (TPR) repeat protein